MDLDKTPNSLNRESRNKENDNWERIERLAKSINDLVIESGGDSNAEVVQARGGKDLLVDRLEEISKESKDYIYEIEKLVADLNGKKASAGELIDGLKTKLDKNGNEQISWGMLDQSVKDNLSSDSYPAVDEDSVNTKNIVDGAVYSKKRTNLGEIGVVHTTGGEVDFNFEDKTIVFKENNRIIWRDDYYTLREDVTVSMKDDDDDSNQVITFNTSSNKLNTEKFHKRNDDENIIILGSFTLDIVNFFTGKYTVNGESELLKLQKETNYLIGFMSTGTTIDFNKEEDKIIFPSGSRVWCNREYFDVDDKEELEMPKYSDLIIAYNRKEERFRAIKNHQTGHSNEMSYDDIVLGYFNRSAELATINADYTVNGKHPYGANEEKENSEVIPSYFKKEIKEVTRKTAEEQSSDTLTFAFFTDIHASEGRHHEYGMRHLRNLKEVSKKGQLDFIVLGGDIINGTDDTKNESLDRLSELMSVVYDSHIPVYTLFGNHDSNGMDSSDNRYDRLITKDEWYNYTLRPFKNNVTHDSKNPMSAYYFTDYEEHKVRIIMLDSIDHPYEDAGDNEAKYHGRNYRGFEQQQINWLCNEALKNVPEDYKILILSHTPLIKDYMIYDTKVSNGKLVEDVFDAFQNGESLSKEGESLTDENAVVDVDFAEQGKREIVGMIVGHSHVDGIFEDSDTGLGYPIINVPCTKNDPRQLDKDYFHDDLSWASVPDRESRTVSEDAWDTVTIDFEKSKIHLTRFGAGDDRKVSF